LPYVKNCLSLREKNMSITTFGEKTIKFTISHSFIIFYLFNWTYSLEDSIFYCCCRKENSILFFFDALPFLSLSISTRATLSLSLSFPFSLALCSLPNFAKTKKRKLMMWLSHSMICSALFCYRVSFCQLVVNCSFC
jgi:hypothetical protein